MPFMCCWTAKTLSKSPKDRWQTKKKKNQTIISGSGLIQLLYKDSWKLGFPGGAVVENLPANAGDTGSSPGLGRSHMPRSNWAREPQLLSLRFWSLCSATRETAIVRGPRTAMKSGPRLPQLEKTIAQKRRPNIAINQSINKSLKKKKKWDSICSSDWA